MISTSESPPLEALMSSMHAFRFSVQFTPILEISSMPGWRLPIGIETPAMCCLIRFSWFLFQIRSNSSVYSFRSTSINLAQFEQSQIPLIIDERSGAVKIELYRGPPAAAAVIWAATPMLTERCSS
ncbi:hypothetical protein THICB2_510020 [Thiomonas sp. CB2]|nr:hypothetical protein THICB2_510020 [Thiomonas sp. CB2]